MAQLTPAKLAVLQRGLTQADLAEQVGIHRSRICDILNNRVRPNSDERLRIAKVLGLQEKDLFPNSRRVGVLA